MDRTKPYDRHDPTTWPGDPADFPKDPRKWPEIHQKALLDRDPASLNPAQAANRQILLAAQGKATETRAQAERRRRAARLQRAVSVAHLKLQGLGELPEGKLAILAEIVRQCLKSDQFCTIKTYGQIAEDAGYSRNYAIQAVKDAKDLYSLKVQVRPGVKDGQRYNRPNVFILTGALLRYAKELLGVNKRKPPGNVYNKHYPTEDFLQEKTETGVGSKGGRPRRGASAAGRPSRRPASSPGHRTAVPAEPSASSPQKCLGMAKPSRIGTPDFPNRDIARLQATCSAAFSQITGQPVAAETGAIIAAAHSVKAAHFRSIDDADWIRAVEGRGLWAAAALAGTLIKAQTHTKVPIRQPGRYFAALVWRPAEGDRIGSIEATVNGHLQATAAGVKTQKPRQEE